MTRPLLLALLCGAMALGARRAAAQAPIAPALTGPNWRHITGTYDAIIDRIDTGLPGTLMVPHPGGITESQVFLVASYIYAVSHQKTKP